MRTIQAVARYFPDNCGGIQTHLSELLPILQDQGVESQVAASQDEPTENTYEYRGVEVYRYPVFPRPKAEPNHGAYPHGGFEYFAHWLKQQTADIYHQHQWTPKCGLPHLRLAKELGMKTVVSVRLPDPICQRGTLMLNGQEQCDGKIDVVRCSQCCGVSRKLSPELIKSLSQTPMPVSVIAGAASMHLERRVPAPLSTTAKALLQPLAIPAFVAARLQGLQEMAKYADRIVVMSEWVGEAIAINGIPREKLFLLRHGISESFIKQKVSARQRQPGPLRVGFLGRWNPTKGIHVLVEAVKCLPPNIPIELVIHGIADSESYFKQVMARINNDPRIRLAPQLKRQEIPLALSSFDVLAVASQWLETGPVVVLEAHAHGLPVVGSDLGGISEKVKHGVDGLLVSASDPKAWAEAFAKLALDSNFLAKLRAGIQPVRTIAMEAADSVTLYESILEEQPADNASKLSASLELQPQ